MSSIAVTQGTSPVLQGRAEIGARCFPTFDGPTATWAWVLTAVPYGSVAVMSDAAGPQPYFETDAYGRFDIQFTDDAANVFTTFVVAMQPIGDSVNAIADETQGRAYFMPDTVGINGRRTVIGGQSTNAPSLGGPVEIAAGAGAASQGVVISERALGGIWETYPICTFYAQGGSQSIMSCVGGSGNHFTVDASGLGTGVQVTIFQFLGSVSTGYLYDAGTYHIFRTAGGGVVGDTELLRMAGTGIGLFGASPTAQGARPGQLTDNTTGAVDGTLVDVGLLFNQANINNNFADLADRVNKLEAYLALRGDIA